MIDFTYFDKRISILARRLDVKKADKPGELKKPVTPIALAVRLGFGCDFAAASSVLVGDDLSIAYAVMSKVSASTTVIITVEEPRAEYFQKVLAESNDFGRGRQPNNMPNGVALVCYNSADELENNLKEMMAKKSILSFDIAVMNPPYGDLHLPILKMVVENLSPTGMAVSIQPIRWLQDPLWRVKKGSDAKKMQPILDGKIDSIEVISAKKAIEIFGIERFTMDLGIIVLKKSGGSYNYRTLSERPHGIDISGVSKFFDSRTGFKLEKYNPQMKHFVPMMIIAGGSNRGEFQNWIVHRAFGYVTEGLTNACKYGNGISIEQAWANCRNISTGKVSNLPVKSFGSAAEAKHFFDFIRLEPLRFFVYVTTMDAHVQCESLPIPTEPDAFKEPWSSDRFYKYFKIDAASRKIIEETMKDKSSDPYGWLEP